MGFDIGSVISSIGGSIFKNLDLGGIVNSPIGKAGINLLEELGKSIFAGGSKGGPFADQIDLGFIKLPDPLAKFNPTLMGLGEKVTKAADLLGKLGKFLTGGFSALENGKTVSVPSLPDRAGTDAAASQNVAKQVSSGAYDNAIAKSTKAGSNAAGYASTGGAGSASSANVFGGGSLNTDLTADQQQALSGLSGQEKARMEAQFRMQNKAELISFISNMMKMQHDMQMAIISNLR
jgi:hypothetical protein